MKNFNVIEKIKINFLKKFEILCKNIPPHDMLSIQVINLAPSNIPIMA